MKFKVGDKIKIVSKVFWIDKYFTNKTGVVVKVATNVEDSFPYVVCIDTEKVPVYEYEIEKTSYKGEQLLLFEM